MKQRAHSRSHATVTEPVSVISRRECALAALGFGIGAVIGGIAGATFGFGVVALPSLAPLVAGGAGVTTVVFGVIGGTLGALGLTVPLLLNDAPQDTRHQQSHASLIMRLPVYGSVALVAFVVLTLWIIASRALGAAGEVSDQGNRLSWNLKNSTRILGNSENETAQRVLQAAYPSTRTANTPRVRVIASNDWRIALAATPLIAPPVDAVVTLQQQKPPFLSDRPTLNLVGEPSEVAAQVDARVGEPTGTPSTVMIVAADSDYRYATPAAPYAARTGTPILFVTRDAIPSQTAAALMQRRGQAQLYVIGGSDQISEPVLDALSRYGVVQRIGGGTIFEHAVRFAEFYDPRTGFGWGRTGRDRRQWNSSRSLVVNVDRWQDAILAAHLARSASGGPLVFVESNGVPSLVDAFFWRQRPTFGSTPAEGPFNHVWVVGDASEVSYATQAWIDYSQEIEQYMTLGDSAVSGFEALGIAWMVLSFGSAVWILLHTQRRLHQVMPMMKAAWVIFGLLLGPIAVLLYLNSYDRTPTSSEHGITEWQRSPWGQTVSATVMMFAFDMMLMVLAVFALAYVGFPILRSGSPVYWLGTSMFLMMALMYIAALVLMMLVFHGPMTAHEKSVPYAKALVVGFPLMAATMTIESIGMMPTMWWSQMLFLPAMQMPTEDDFSMWTTLLMSVAVAFLAVLPFNYWTVRRGWKAGTM